MIPEKKSNIVIYFKNALQFEGKVIEWSPEIILESKLGNIIVIKAINEILAFKIIKENEVISKKSTKIAEKIADAYNMPSSHPERLKNLAELKKQLIVQEKEIVSNKLKDHYPTGTKEIYYGGLSRFCKK